MALIHKSHSERVLVEVAAFAVDRLVERYKSMADERGRLHRMSFDQHVPEAEEALYLIEKPFDDLAGIASQLGRSIKAERYSELTRVLAHSPIARRQELIDWLAGQAACQEVANFLEGADALRLLLGRAMRLPESTLPGKQIA